MAESIESFSDDNVVRVVVKEIPPMSTKPQKFRELEKSQIAIMSSWTKVQNRQKTIRQTR
jgi:hypothetical protein